MRSIYTCTTGMFSRTLHAQHLVTTNLNTSPRFSPTIFYRDANSVPTSTPFYTSTDRLCAQNLGFEIVREESVKVYLHMHNGNVEQNPLCVESCVTNGFSISPRLSPTIFDPDANSVLLRAHLCTAVVDVMCRKACVRNCSRERVQRKCPTYTPLYSSSLTKLYAQYPVFEIVHGESVIVYLHIMYSGNVQQNPLCVESSCVTGVFHLSPVLAYDFLSQCKFSTPTNPSTPLYSCINRLYAQNPVFDIVREESMKVYLHMYSGHVQQILCVESCFTKEYSISPGSRQRCLIPMQIQCSYEHTFVQQ